MPFFNHDGLAFYYRDLGEGLPFVFQHGLGGDVSQPFSLLSPPPGFRMLAFDCRAHGETRPLGPADRIGIGAFADDLCAFLNHLTLERAVIGGISMGAALALHFALHQPWRVLGLVLSRPAWLDEPNADNVQVFGQIAGLIRQHGARRGRAVFQEAETYRRILTESPDAASSLLGQFEHPRAEETVVKLERIPRDSPCLNLQELESIRVPTLVLANKQDPIHPYHFGTTLARAIPGALFRELTPKSVSKDLHAAGVQRWISEFLQTHFSKDL